MVDKSIKGIEIIVFIVVLIFLSFAFTNAYHISTTYFGMELEQSYIYDTIFIGVLLTITMLYITVYIIYKKQEYVRAYVLLRLFIPILLCLYDIIYLIGLNVDTSFTYQFLCSYWIFGIINIIFMIVNVLIFGKAYYLQKYNKILNVYTVILTLFYLLIFFTIITDSAVYLGLFDWE